MDKFIYKLISISGLSSLLMTIVLGCSEFDPLSKNAKEPKKNASIAYKIPISTVASNIVAFRNYKAYFDGNEVVILGQIQSRLTTDIIRGYVDARIFDADNKLANRARLFQIPKILPDTNNRDSIASKFKIRLPEKPPPGSRIMLSFYRLKDFSVTAVPE